jgi:predicted transcriptional regulator
MATTQKPPTIKEATSPVTREPSPEVRAWQAKKIKAGLKAADEGRFASPEAVKAVVKKFIPNG